MKKAISVLLAFCLIISSFTGFNLVSQAANELTVYDAKTEYMENPIGIDRQDPVFSWKIDKGDSRGIMQSSYTINVAKTEADLANGTNLVWTDSQNTDQCNGIIYSGPELEAATEYFWNVTVTDNEGAQAVSDTVFFAMGLLAEEDWNGAQWISTAGGKSASGEELDSKVYTIECDFNVEYGSLGLIFGHPDANNFYMWQINSDESSEGRLLFRPHVFMSGRNPATIAEYDIEHIMTKEEFLKKDHTIKVEVDNGKFTTWLDGELLTYEVPYGTKTDPSDKTYLEDSSIETMGEVGIRAFYGTQDKDKLSLSRLTLQDRDGKPVYWDDFKGINSLNGGSIVDGKLELTPQKEERYWPKAANDKVYSVQMDVQIEDSAAGIIFAASGSNNFYMWQLNTFNEKGSLLLRPHIWLGGGMPMGGDRNISSVLSAEDAENSMNTTRIDVEDGMITTFINGQFADSRQDSRIENIGQIGFRQAMDDQTQTREIAAFDNIMLRDAGGRVIYFEDFEKAENPYSFGAVENGRFTIGKEGNREVFLIEEETITGESKVPLFRKDFEMEDKEIKRATVYASALGHYELQLNGDKVGEDYMAPGWTEYKTRVQYQSYDVTDQLLIGTDNSLGAMIAPGWYSGNISVLGDNIYGTTQAFIANLVIEYKDGSKQTIVTDDSWRFSLDGPILVTDMFDGETYDANKEINGSKYGWAAADYDNSDWYYTGVMFEDAYSVRTGASGSSAITLSAQIGPTVSKIADVTPVSITEDVNGNYVVDMGQNFAGIVNIDLKGQRGETAVLRYGEMINDDSGTGDGPEGTVYTANLRTAEATDRYIFKSDQTETFETTFTFHGFQYIEISGVSQMPKIEDIRGIALASVMDEVGTFDSSDDLLNQIYENTFWGQRSNFLCIPTDCPQRDERMGWGADTHVFAKTGMYNMDAMMFYQKWLTDVRDGQFGDGGYGDTAPNPHNFHGDVVWNAGGIVVPYMLWKMTGDVRVINDSYESMAKYMQFRASRGNIQACGYGDWLEPVQNASEKNVVGTTYYAYQLGLMAELADAVGKADDAEMYRQRFEAVKKVFTETYINADGSFNTDIQSSYVLTLGSGLASEENEQLLVDNLIRRIKMDGNMMTVGFVAVNMLTPILSKYGYNDIAYQLAMNTDYPSWGYSVEQGATTIWERWDSYTKENGFGDISMNSFNHYSFGSVCQWFYQGIGGIDYDTEQPGFKNIIIEPVYDIRLSYADVSYESIRGNISSRWELDKNGKVQLAVTVPANTTADIILPTGLSSVMESGTAVSAAVNGISAVTEDTENGTVTISAGSGSYVFTFDWEVSLLKVTLEKAIFDGDYELHLEEDYTNASLKVLRAAVNEGIKLFEDEGTDQELIDAATADIQAKIKALEPEENINLAAGRNVSVSSAVSQSGDFCAANLLDGTRKGSGANTWSSSNNITVDHNEWVIIDLGASVDLNTVVMFPRHDGPPSGYGFPKDFDIQVSDDQSNWITIASERNYPFVGIYPQRFVADETVTARYVKIDMPSLNANPADNMSYRAQLAEIEIYNIDQIPEDTDKTALEDLVESLKGEKEADYTYASWSSFDTAFKNAQSILNNEEALQKDVDEAFANLKTAAEGLKAAANDPWYLEYVISLADMYEDEAKTAVPYVKNMYDTALATAEKLLADAKADPRNVTIEETDVAAHALLRTFRWLSYQSGDKGVLSDLIRQGQDILDNKDDYEEESIVGMEEILKDAQAVYSNENALDQDIIDIAQKLENAVKNAQKKDITEPDKTRLAELIAEAEDILANKDTYIASSIEGLDKILEGAKKIYNSQEASQKDIDQAVKDLAFAVSKARLIPDKSKLEELIAKAENVDTAKFTEETVNALTAALSYARIVFNNPEADQTEVDLALRDLQSAFDSLKLREEFVPDKIKLKELITAAEKLQEKEYTKESWNALTEALKAAKEVYEDDKAIQKDVDDAYNTLKSAMDSLKKAEPDPGPGQTGESDTDDQTNDPKSTESEDDTNRGGKGSGNGKDGGKTSTGKKSPKTGDTAPIILLSAVGLAALFIFLKRVRKVK